MKRIGTERHHIYPKQRIKYPTALIKATDHVLYHKIFGIKTPEEVMDWLVENVWGGKLEIIKSYLKRRIYEKDYFSNLPNLPPNTKIRNLG